MTTTPEIELPLADPMRQFETSKGDGSGRERFQPFRRSQSRLDAAVV